MAKPFRKPPPKPLKAQMAAAAKQRLKNLAKARAVHKASGKGNNCGRSPIQRQQDDIILSRMIDEGASYDAMGKALGLSTGHAHREAKRILNARLEEQDSNIEVHRQKMLSHIDHVYREANQGWQRSQEDKQSIETTKRVADAMAKGNIIPTGPNKAGKTAKLGQKKSEATIVKVEGQVGDPRFLAVMIKCKEVEAKLRGLEAPAQGKPDDMYKTTEDTRALIESRLQSLSHPVMVAQPPDPDDGQEEKKETIN
jgi:hypothetical protein